MIVGAGKLLKVLAIVQLEMFQLVIAATQFLEFGVSVEVEKMELVVVTPKFAEVGIARQVKFYNPIPISFGHGFGIVADVEIGQLGEILDACEVTDSKSSCRNPGDTGHLLVGDDSIGTIGLGKEPVAEIPIGEVVFIDFDALRPRRGRHRQGKQQRQDCPPPKG